jgi:hypothetical protein
MHYGIIKEYSMKMKMKMKNKLFKTCLFYSMTSAVFLSVMTPIASAQNIFTEDFDGYDLASCIGYTGNQFETGLTVRAGSSSSCQAIFPGWTGGGVHPSHAVDLDSSSGVNFALQLFSGNTLTLNTGIAANDANIVYNVTFDAAPSVWSASSQVTESTDGILIEMLRTDGTVLDTFTALPGAWPGGTNAQDSFNPASFSYTGDGSGDVRIHLTTNSISASNFGGAIDNLVVQFEPQSDSPFTSHAAISGGAINIAAGSTVNGDLAAQAAVVIGANAVIDHNIYAGAAVTTGALSTVENIFSGAAAGIGANAFAQNIHAGAAITIGASSQVQAVYAGAAITLGAGASTNGVLLEDANADVYAEAGDIRNAGNMAEVITLITNTQSALSDLAPSSANGPLSTTMGTRTLAPGVWEGSAVSIAASSTITFDADEYSDNADHVWVINLSEALTVGASTNFEITGLGNGDTATIIWNVGAALNLGAGTSFRGTAFVGGAVNAATSSVSCGHLYATGAISIGSIGVDSNGSPVTCESSDAVFTYLEALD